MTAPAPSRASLAPSASSRGTPCSTGWGAVSTNSLASFSPQVGERAHLLDDLDLLVADLCEHDVEGGLLLFGGGCLGGAGGGCRHGHRRNGSGCGDPEALLELLEELAQLQHGHGADGVEDFVDLGHDGSPCSCLGAFAFAGRPFRRASGSGGRSQPAERSSISARSRPAKLRAGAAASPANSPSGALSSPAICRRGLASAPASCAWSCSAGGSLDRCSTASGPTESVPSKPP